ncbi:XRE family transcriptional regulator [Rhodococcus sp. ABRD24]|uniref:helix-turn-helix transcriptional regulator n=1 Tax=Rhodococcus sp. ABRD24 TaxID=2507582 RepID=UPI0010402E32|nr:helix-turn-helix transcriptional regulator [Rhodococcus sp. ABRD24]QBJ98418.1 XRE family transcriptional regulator [Rhodococcus sp. ABRD24]
MYVLTVDQRHSRRDVDRVGDLLSDLGDRPLLRPFERTAGDEVQAVDRDPAMVVDLALDLVRRGHWSVGIGVGAVEEPLPEQTRAGRGPAFEAARTAVERAKKMPVAVAVEAADNDASLDADAALMLVAMLVSRRSAQGHAAVALMARGLTQAEAASELGISKQAVSQRLAAAGWQAEMAGRRLTERLLRRADR